MFMSSIPSWHHLPYGRRGIRRIDTKAAARSVEMMKTGDVETFDFSLATKRQLEAQRKELVLTDSTTLRYQFQRIQDEINWEALRQAGTEDEVNAALSGVDQLTRDQLPNAAAILATVRDQNYPKLRPIRFLSTIHNMLYTPIYCGMLQHTRICRADRCQWAVVLAMWRTKREYISVQQRIGWVIGG
jgi:hypothetical protein